MQEAWERKIRREQMSLGHVFAVLINTLGSFLFGNKFEGISGVDIFPEPKKVIPIVDETMTAGQAGLLAYFKSKDLLHNQKMIKEAQERKRLANGE
jgi:hypothetical protein